ncbi:unnamed protein product [Peronospora belbahrii]|uniref:C2H2-type domain-containing protein n=1 Tax=Peronospora belbahrii TaxID=622444 RepID=A0ABN8D6Z8_9STRA|nr:unnamed protein product [Peronospora belbahrii]
MKTKKQRKTRIDAPDVAMLDSLESKAKHRVKNVKKTPSKALKLVPTTDKIAAFKETKHLKIETKDLGQDKKNEPDAEKSTVPLSTSKKRRRRSAAEIDRKFKCPFAGCVKAYGSEGSLIHHQKLKHPERVDLHEKDNQVGTFLLPLHNTPRNVMIRPATPLVTFLPDQKLLLSKQSTNDRDNLASSLDVVPPSAKTPRCNMRSRSESDPVTFMEEQTKPRVAISTATIMTKSGPKTSCKPYRIATPYVKKAATATATRCKKLCSKSESLPEMNPLQPFDELIIPSYYRSDSSASAHEAILPISSTGSIEHRSFEWPATLISASRHHSASLSSDEQAIDSDILSVLANCDEEETSLMSDFGGGPPSTNLYQSDSNFGEMKGRDMLPVGMECFKIAENATLPTQVAQEFVMNEPEAELGMKAFASLAEDCTNALVLSDHLKKMSMAQEDTPPHSLVSTFGKVVSSEDIVHRFRSMSDPVHDADPILTDLSHFSSVQTDTFSVKATGQLSSDNELVGENHTNLQQRSGNFCTLELAKIEDGSIQKMLWLSGAAGVATVSNSQPSSEALDQLLQHDDTLEGKPSDVFENEEEISYALVGPGTTPTLL